MAKGLLLFQTILIVLFFSGTAFSAPQIKGDALKKIVSGKTLLVTVDTSRAYQKQISTASVEKEYNADGNLTVTAKDQTTKAKWQINNSGLLCEKEEEKAEECFIVYTGAKGSYFLYKRSQKGVARFGSFSVK